MKFVNVLENQKQLDKIIDSEISKLIWNKKKYTTPLKICALMAFKNVLQKYESKFVKYLIYNSRAGGFQNKLFHEFIRLVDLQLPFFCEKNKKKYVIDNINDPRLNIFSGKDVFTSVVVNGIINNKTTKTYIGGRKASYIKPYYIGKLISVHDRLGTNLINLVESYSFEKIVTSGIIDNTEVEVAHMMVVPHYQMGAMLYINRARKNIVNKFHALE